MVPNFLTRDPEREEAIQRKQKQDSRIMLGIIFLCVVFYYYGKQQGQQAGRLEALSEVGPISNQPALMKQYLQKHGVYMFSSAELDAAYR
jgi:hypothetical protein